MIFVISKIRILVIGFVIFVQACSAESNSTNDIKLQIQEKKDRAYEDYKITLYMADAVPVRKRGVGLRRERESARRWNLDGRDSASGLHCSSFLRVGLRCGSAVCLLGTCGHCGSPWAMSMWLIQGG